MSRLCEDIHRAMQMAFDTRTLADRLEGMIVKPEIDDVGKAFIASRDMFFLTTIDHNDRPTVSYKCVHPVSCAFSTRRRCCFRAVTATACIC